MVQRSTSKHSSAGSRTSSNSIVPDAVAALPHAGQRSSTVRPATSRSTSDTRRTGSGSPGQATTTDRSEGRRQVIDRCRGDLVRSWHTSAPAVRAAAAYPPPGGGWGAGHSPRHGSRATGGATPARAQRSAALENGVASRPGAGGRSVDAETVEKSVRIGLDLVRLEAIFDRIRRLEPVTGHEEHHVVRLPDLTLTDRLTQPTKRDASRRLADTGRIAAEKRS